MFSFLLKLFVFVGIGLLLTVVPEWQNNVLMNAESSGWPGYFNTLQLNAALLVLAFLLFRFLNRKYDSAKALIFQFTVWGIIGLLFEWILINHPPWSDAIQSIMFIYWGVVFSAPAVFLLERAEPIRLKLLIFIFTTAILMVLGSFIALSIDSKGFLLIFITLSWALIYVSIIGFLFQAMGYVSKRKWLFVASILVPAAEVVLPFPLNFFMFLVIIFCSYWYVIKYLSLENLSPKT